MPHDFDKTHPRRPARREPASAELDPAAEVPVDPPVEERVVSPVEVPPVLPIEEPPSPPSLDAYGFEPPPPTDANSYGACPPPAPLPNAYAYDFYPDDALPEACEPGDVPQPPDEDDFPPAFERLTMPQTRPAAA